MGPPKVRKKHIPPQFQPRRIVGDEKNPSIMGGAKGDAPRATGVGYYKMVAFQVLSKKKINRREKLSVKGAHKRGVDQALRSTCRKYLTVRCLGSCSFVQDFSAKKEDVHSPEERFPLTITSKSQFLGPMHAHNGRAGHKHLTRD